MRSYLKCIIVFVLLTIIGFIPWESILSIQIRNDVLVWFTSASMGLIGLSLTLILYIRLNKIRFSFILIIFFSFLALISFLLTVVTFVLPNFDWKDTDVYCNDNDYLVVQEQEGFVTSNLTYPRIIRTSSPYSMIRVIEAKYYMKGDGERFEGNEVTYDGKTWFKVPTKKE